MSDVPDDVFYSGAIGKGYAVKPDGNKVIEPFNRKSFTVYVKDGDSVKAVDVLTTFDRDMIAAHNLSSITPVIVTNSATYADVLVQASNQTDTTTPILTIVNQ